MRLSRSAVSALIPSCFAGILSYIALPIPVLAVLVASAAAAAPILRRRHIRRKQALQLRQAWPVAIGDTISAIRSGAPAHEALLAAMARMPAPLSHVSEAIAADIRATGRVDDALRHLVVCAPDDPVVGRVVLAVRLARSLGSADIISILADLADSARDELELLGTIEARRSWVVASAAVASAAPWAIVVSLSIRGSAREAYASAGGSVVLASAALMSAAAFAAMRRIGHIAEPHRLVVR